MSVHDVERCLDVAPGTSGHFIELSLVYEIEENSYASFGTSQGTHIRDETFFFLHDFHSARRLGLLWGSMLIDVDLGNFHVLF